MLRIAMITVHSSPMGELGTRDTGGMSVYVWEVARRLAQRGHAVDVFTRAQGHDGPRAMEPFPNVRIIHLNAGPSKPLPQASLYGHLPEFFENLEHFREGEGTQYDLVHSHYYLSGAVGQWARSCWQVPHVFMFHTLGVLKNRIAGSYEEPEMRIAMERALAEECDLILATTERERSWLLEHYRAQPEKIHVVPCGVDLERFRPMERAASRDWLGLNGAAKVILYVGRFDPVKGVDRLLGALAELRREMPLRLILVGGGGENALEDRQLHALCSELSLEDSVTFAGRRTHGELPGFYSAADVVVLPSHYESFGLVVLEALACGTPVVASRVGAVEDVVRSGVNGWVITENSPHCIAQGIRRVLATHHVRNRTSDVVRWTVKNYDWNHVAGSLDRAYQALVQRHGASVGQPGSVCHSVC